MTYAIRRIADVQAQLDGSVALTVGLDKRLDEPFDDLFDGHAEDADVIRAYDIDNASVGRLVLIVDCGNEARALEWLRATLRTINDEIAELNERRAANQRAAEAAARTWADNHDVAIGRE